MSITPINPSSSDYSQKQNSVNVNGQLTFAIQSLETYILALLNLNDKDNDIPQPVLSQLFLQLQELQGLVKKDQISSSGAAQELQEITDNLNNAVPDQYSYPTESPPYGAQEQLEGLIAFLKITSPDSPMIGQVQELLNQLNNGTFNPQQVMQQLMPIISQLQNTNIGYPIPTPSDYPS